MNIVTIENGKILIETVGFEDLLSHPDKWESYDFVERQWISGKYETFWANPFPYPVGIGFLDKVSEYVAHLPSETIVIIHMTNESFGALRLKSR